jgi:hypothetical protein
MPGRRPITAVFAVVAVVLAVVLIVSAGSDDSSSESAEIPGGADPAQVQVVVDWAQAESSGDNEAAADYFAIPSFAQNGFNFHIKDVDDARRFNASLPCGAIVEEAVEDGHYIIVTFRLSERANSNDCGAGAGQTARTAFLIENGKIVEWRRVATQQDGERPAPSAST